MKPLHLELPDETYEDREIYCIETFEYDEPVNHLPRQRGSDATVMLGIVLFAVGCMFLVSLTVWALHR